MWVTTYAVRFRIFTVFNTTDILELIVSVGAHLKWQSHPVERTRNPSVVRKCRIAGSASDGLRCSTWYDLALDVTPKWRLAMYE